MNRKVANKLLIAVAVILLIAAAVFFMSGRSIKNKDLAFMNSCIKTTGEIIGYRQIDQGGSVPTVAFNDNGKAVTAEAKGVKINPRTHPEGTKVKLAYVPVKIMGIAGFDVRIINQDGTVPESKNSVIVSNVMAGVLLTLALLIATIILRGNAPF